MAKRIYCIRGAVCAENTEASIMENVGNMCREIFSSNKIYSNDLVSIHFTMTRDLDVLNAAKALRLSDVGIDVTGTALFTSQEAEIKGMIPRTIRVMVSAYLEEGSQLHHVYQNGAEKLRPDFANK